MRQLTLIRHAVTDWNANGKFQGQTDVELSAKGRTQAQKLAKRLARVKVDRVVSSPSHRAVESARIALPGREVETDPRLLEIHFGIFEGRTLKENKELPAWHTWYADPFGLRAPEGESYGDLRQRAVAWLETVPEDEHTVAFTHSGTIQMLISHVMGVEYPRWRKRVFLRHTSLTVIMFQEGDAIIERVNDAKHLGNEEGNPFDE